MYEPWLNSLRGGDGHPVLVIPGFTAGDRSTTLLRKFLSSLGYLPCGWKQGVNFGARHDLFVGAGELLMQIHEQYECRVSIVGQSLGGIYARELAKNLPDADHKTKTQQFLSEDWELQKPPPVPTTSIYSKFDGICHWRACLQRGDHDPTPAWESTPRRCSLSRTACRSDATSGNHFT
jgi:hypothetical protein